MSHSNVGAWLTIIIQSGPTDEYIILYIESAYITFFVQYRTVQKMFELTLKLISF